MNHLLFASLWLVAPWAVAQNAPAAATPATSKTAEPTSPRKRTLNTGDTVSPEILGRLAWIQGEAPKVWEPGKVYVLECWATWCGPCVANIPHLNELHKTYGPKGLRVIGVDVQEEGQEKVAAFVKARGEGMSYPVAYTGKGGAFETEWLNASGKHGIPHAFVVKDGQLLFHDHPAVLTKEIIEALLVGGDTQTKIVAHLLSLDQAIRAYEDAKRVTNLDLMEKKLGEIEKIDPAYRGLFSMRMNVFIERFDDLARHHHWDKAEAYLKSFPESPYRPYVLARATSRLSRHDENLADLPASVSVRKSRIPVSLWKTLADLLAADLVKQPDADMEYLSLAEAQWRAGERDAAMAAAKAGLKVVENQPPSRMLSLVFQNYLKALGEGRLPSETDLDGWIRAAMKPGVETKPK